MANTGNFIYNILEVESSGVPISGSPFTVPLVYTAEQLSELTNGVLTVNQAQSLLDSRIITDASDPNVIGCSPGCLTPLGLNEFPAEAVINQQVGESWHAMIEGVKTCVTHITQ